MVLVCGLTLGAVHVCVSVRTYMYVKTTVVPSWRLSLAESEGNADLKQ